MEKFVNSEIKKVAKELNQMILSSQEYQNYHDYETMIKNNPSLHQIEEKLKQLQKQIVNARYHESDELENLKQEYENLMNVFSTNPLVCNYISELESLNDLLQYINHYLNGAIK